MVEIVATAAERGPSSRALRARAVRRRPPSSRRRLLEPTPTTRTGTSRCCRAPLLEGPLRGRRRRSRRARQRQGEPQARAELASDVAPGERAPQRFSKRSLNSSRPFHALSRHAADSRARSAHCASSSASTDSATCPRRSPAVRPSTSSTSWAPTKPEHARTCAQTARTDAAGAGPTSRYRGRAPITFYWHTSSTVEFRCSQWPRLVSGARRVPALRSRGERIEQSVEAFRWERLG